MAKKAETSKVASENVCIFTITTDQPATGLINFLKIIDTCGEVLIKKNERKEVQLFVPRNTIPKNGIQIGTGTHILCPPGFVLQFRCHSDIAFRLGDPEKHIITPDLNERETTLIFVPKKEYVPMSK